MRFRKAFTLGALALGLVASPALAHEEAKLARLRFNAVDDARGAELATKALARDQEAGLRDLMRAAKMERPAIVYDGDTPADARRAAPAPRRRNF